MLLTKRLQESVPTELRSFFSEDKHSVYLLQLLRRFGMQKREVLRGGVRNRAERP